MLARGASVLGPHLNGPVEVRDASRKDHVETFEGWARWSGTSFAAAAVTGAIAALTVPGRRSAYEALQQLIENETVRQSFGLSLP